MKYIKRFDKLSDYQAFISNGGGVNLQPHMATIGTIGDVYLKETNGRNVGDIAYWDGSKVKTISQKLFNSRLGTPIGIVVIPHGFTPDGKTRIVSLYEVDANGDKVTSIADVKWGPMGVNTSLTNYTKVPTTDNNGSTSTGSSSHGFLPSDKFTGSQSYIDPKAKYKVSTNLIPSPYFQEIPNPEYNKTIEDGNALSDFNGLNNTRKLVGLNTEYEAANAAWKYKDGSSNLQWYLPAIGELGYIIVRLNEIDNSINKLGGLLINSDYAFWSSSQYTGNYPWYLNSYYGLININQDTTNNSKYHVRPFAIIE